LQLDQLLFAKGSPVSWAEE